MILLSEAANILGIKLLDDDSECTSVSHDTRTLEPGALYVAIRGDAHDGHTFVSQAKARGAQAVLVERWVDVDLPQLIVPDTTQALVELACAYRSRFPDLTVAAITGSCGKTTTRALLESIYAQAGPTIASVKSFNNIWGVPLTLLRIKPEHRYLVAELGANQPGEIAPLAVLVKPQLAVVLNIAPTHLEGFGSLEVVSETKGAIFDALPEDGVAVINADDDYADSLRVRAGSRRILSFGIEHAADITVKNLSVDATAHATFELIFPEGESSEIHLQLVGRHQIYNAMAAGALAYASGCTPEQIKNGLEATLPVENRLNTIVLNNHVTVINDTYNANPKATCASLDVLARHPGASVFVFGDMLEMGQDSSRWHQEVGAYAKASGVSMMLCFGPQSQAAVSAFGEGARHFETQDAMIAVLQEVVQTANDRLTLLVKGSLSMNMARIVSALSAEIREG